MKTLLHPDSKSAHLLRWLLGGLLLAFTLSAPARAGVETVVGRYEGAWTNLTFGSTGKAVIDISVNGATAATTFDMDGFVFGAFDPPVINMPGTVVGDTIQIDSQGVGLFGNILGSINSTAGTFEAVLTQIPGGFIAKVTATGTIGSGKLDLDYVVDFPGPTGPTNPALGVLVANQPVPLVLAPPVPQGNELRLTWTGGTAPYQVQVRNNLSTGEWANEGTATSNTSAVLAVPASGIVFIRVAGQ